MSVLRLAVNVSKKLVLSNVSSKRSLHNSLLRCQSDRHAPDYYSVLGLNKSATKEQVKYAYFKKAKQFHPDTNPSEESRLMFQLAAEAYDVLSDKVRRKHYDEFGSDSSYVFGGMAGGPRRPRDHLNQDAEELYDKIFGEAKGKSSDFEMPNLDYATSYSGSDWSREYRICLQFDEAAKGVMYPIHLRAKVVCPKCHGSKSELGYTWQVCMYCEGTGVETEKVGHVLTRKTCSYCNGTKEFHKFKCIECEGTGAVIKSFVHQIIVPPGTADGQVLISSIDPVLMDYAAGDQADMFYVYVSVYDSEHYTREDLDLFSEADISISQAVLGGDLRIKGLFKNPLAIEIPPGTNSHSLLVAHDEGVRREFDDKRGHHFVRVGIQMPEELEDDQMELWEKYAATENNEDLNGIVNGVETENSHKFKNGVIVEPDKVTRNTFNKKSKKTKDSLNEKGAFRTWWDGIFQTS